MTDAAWVHDRAGIERVGEEGQETKDYRRQVRDERETGRVLPAWAVPWRIGRGGVL